MDKSIARSGHAAAMRFLLNAVYCGLIVCLLPLILWRMIVHGKYREGLPQKTLGLVPRRSGEQACIWFHAVSVGEVNLLPDVIEAFESKFPNCQVVVSATTATGYQLAMQRFPEKTVFYCPLDFSWAVRRAIGRLRPNMLVLAELELWPNLIEAADESGAAVVVLNARLSQRSFNGYRRASRFLRPTLNRISLVLSQNQTYADRFIELGVDAQKTKVTGSIKFDGARGDREASCVRAVARLLNIQPQQSVWIVGSTQQPEEQIALEVYKALRSEFSDLRLIIVPRHRERFELVARQIPRSGLNVIRRTELNQPLEDWKSDSVVLLDTIGELSAWWGVADIAYVGGSMGSRGGQNMLEPSAYGAAVSFGPNTKNFRDIVSALLAAEAACVVRDQAALLHFVRRCIEQPEYRDTLGRSARRLVGNNQGAIKSSIDSIAPLVDSIESHCQARAA